MSRLTERDKYDGGFWVKDKYGEDRWFSPKGKLYKPIAKLAYYEDLEEQGRLIELPCKVGDTVWLVEKDFPQYPPIKFKFSRKSDIMREMEKGMIFEKTKEEAEAKLAELKGAKNDTFGI
jgi:hypothetical protein